MKRRILTVALALGALVMTNEVNAQKGAAAGIMYMPQSTWIVNQNDFDDPNVVLEPTMGSALGVTLHNNFTDNVGIEIDVLFSTQGQEYTNFGVATKKELKYTKLPLMLTFNSDPSKALMFIGKFGPQLSFLRSAEHSGNFGGITLSGDAKEYYKSSNLTVVLGFGLGVNLGTSLQATAGLRLDYSLQDIEDKDNSGWSSAREKSYNGLVGLEFGVRYRF